MRNLVRLVILTAVILILAHAVPEPSKPEPEVRAVLVPIDGAPDVVTRDDLSEDGIGSNRHHEPGTWCVVRGAVNSVNTLVEIGGIPCWVNTRCIKLTPHSDLPLAGKPVPHPRDELPPGTPHPSE